jgi:hypothetical protein
MEFLTVLTDRLAMEKGATCITSDILNRVAREGTASSLRILKNHGLVALSETVKGASYAPASQGDKVMAAALIFKSARLAPVVATLAASEMMDMIPNLAQMCAAMGPDKMDKMAGAASLMHMSWLRPSIVKTAAEMEETHPLLRALVDSLVGARNQRHESVQTPADAHESEARDKAMTSDVSGSMGEDNEGAGAHVESDDDEAQGQDDAVDSFMADPKSAPPPQG